ncbi:hypothetical protein LJC33_02525 [Eubacteriales bacterium OttesenSCG-928-N13]|nr:hypothetical protein [Eubacteriales bacterium OttesenSCG-928-N13]
MAISLQITSATLSEGNASIASIMPAYTYIRDRSIINYTFTAKWSGASKVTEVESTIEIRNSAGARVGWVLAKLDKTTATSGTKTYTGTLLVPVLSSSYGPGVTSLDDGNYTVIFDFSVWNGSSGSGISTNDRPVFNITYATLNAPKVTAFDIYRATSAGARSDEGTYLRYSVAASITPVVSTDRGTFTLRYRPSTTSTWSSITLGSSVTSVNVSAAQLPINCAISNSCEFELVITDRYTTVTIPKFIPTGAVLMHFKADKTGVAIGKYAETSNLFDVNLPTRFRQSVSFDNPAAALRAVGVIYSTTLPASGVEGQVCLVPI